LGGDLGGVALTEMKTYRGKGNPDIVPFGLRHEKFEMKTPAGVKRRKGNKTPRGFELRNPGRMKDSIERKNTCRKSWIMIRRVGKERRRAPREERATGISAAFFQKEGGQRKKRGR